MMIDTRYLHRIDGRIVLVMLALMGISLLVLAATDPIYIATPLHMSFFTPKVQSQLQRFLVGWLVFIFFAAMDYNKLREWAWILYLFMTFALIGLFLAPKIQNVHRWYRIPFLHLSIQPSEYAKLIMVIAMSWFLEKSHMGARSFRSSLQGLFIAGIPFLLILKQPDLGTALVLCPITCVMFYLGNLHLKMVRIMMLSGALMFLFISLIFSGVFPHEKMRPFMLRFMKEYQYERLNPENHHQWAATTAIGVGGLTGSGFRSSEFTGRGWLPFAYTDSVFPAFGEEFGFLGLLLLLALFYSLVYFGFAVTLSAKDLFGRMLSAGITVYLAMHIIINIGMMCHLLPVTGVPLILISYGGSSVFVTMAALGMLQSIYSRRFMF